MKEIHELILPENVRYAETHEWARREGDTVVVGISDYAQDQLGEVVYVELPRVGDRFDRGEEFGSVESVKAVGELYMPVAGEVVEVNGELEASPELVNRDPYGAGWIVRVAPEDPAQVDDLLDRRAYLDRLEGEGS